MSSTLIFYFDIVCPFSYLASKLLKTFYAKNARIIWRPVLLGGIYKLTEAPQGKDGSASDPMSSEKQIITSKDLYRNFKRFSIDFKMNEKHPIKTLYAQRILAGISNDELKEKIAKEFYKAMWIDNLDMADIKILKSILEKNNIYLNEKEIFNCDENIKEILFKNTEEAVQRGAFGVPSFYIVENQKFFHGADRLHFVDLYLGNNNSIQPRFFINPFKTPQKLTFFYDIVSPYSYLSATQVEKIAKEGNAVIEFVPIFLGGLLTQIGTPNVSFEVCENKMKYRFQDINEWVKWWNVPFQFSSYFPFASIPIMRVNIAEPKTFHSIFKAAWVDNKNLNEKEEIEKVLNSAGFNGKEILLKSETDEIKKKLKFNSERARKLGVCGVPSFQINNGEIIWGQDKFDIIGDMLCGWDGVSSINDPKIINCKL